MIKQSQDIGAVDYQDMQRVLDLVAAVPGGDISLIYDILLNQENFVPARSLVYSDDYTVYKIMRLQNGQVNLDFAVDRVNRRNSGYIKDYEVLPTGFIKLHLRKEPGSPISEGKLNKDNARTWYSDCLNDIKNNLPYLNRDYCSSNILVSDSGIHIVDWDDILEGVIFHIDAHSHVYNNMRWLWPYVTRNEFADRWLQEFS